MEEIMGTMKPQKKRPTKGHQLPRPDSRLADLATKIAR